MSVPATQQSDSESSLVELFEAELTDQQRLFGFRYVEQFNENKAAKEVSISKAKAKEWLAMPLMRKYIRHLTQDLQDCSLISRAMYESFLLELKPMVMGEEDVALVDKGVPFTAKKFDSTASVRLAQEMGKAAGVEQSSGGTEIHLNFGALGVPESANVQGVNDAQAEIIIEGKAEEVDR